MACRHRNRRPVRTHPTIFQAAPARTPSTHHHTEQDTYGADRITQPSACGGVPVLTSCSCTIIHTYPILLYVFTAPVSYTIMMRCQIGVRPRRQSFLPLRLRVGWRARLPSCVLLPSFVSPVVVRQVPRARPPLMDSHRRCRVKDSVLDCTLKKRLIRCRSPLNRRFVDARSHRAFCSSDAYRKTSKNLTSWTSQRNHQS